MHNEKKKQTAPFINALNAYIRARKAGRPDWLIDNEC